MPDRSKRGSEIANALRNFFTTIKDDLGIVDVFYGDQMRIPNSPTLCVEPATTERVLSNTGLTTANTFYFNIILYDTRLGDVEEIQYTLDQLAEDVVDRLHSIGTLDELIIYGVAERMEYGYLIKSNRLMRADRIMFRAETKTEL